MTTVDHGVETVEPYLLKRVQPDGWCKLVGRYETEADALEAAAQKVGDYRLHLVDTAGYQREIRSRWFATYGENRAWFYGERQFTEQEMDDLFRRLDVTDELDDHDHACDPSDMDEDGRVRCAGCREYVAVLS